TVGPRDHKTRRSRRTKLTPPRKTARSYSRNHRPAPYDARARGPAAGRRLRCADGATFRVAVASLGGRSLLPRARTRPRGPTVLPTAAMEHAISLKDPNSRPTRLAKDGYTAGRSLPSPSYDEIEARRP